MTLEPSDHCLRAPRDARDASLCSPAMSFDSLVRRSVTIDDLCMCRACCVADLADFEGPSTAIGSLAPGAPGPSGLPPRRRGNVTLEETDSETDTEYDMW